MNTFIKEWLRNVAQARRSHPLDVGLVLMEELGRGILETLESDFEANLRVWLEKRDCTIVSATVLRHLVALAPEHSIVDESDPFGWTIKVEESTDAST